MDLIRLAASSIAFASAAVAILALGGAFNSGLDVLTHFAPFCFAGAAAALVLALVSGSGSQTATLALAGVAAVISAGLMAPDIFAAFARQPAPARGEVLKVIQINVWSFNADPAATATWIVAQAPDIVVVEEAMDKGLAVPLALKVVYPFVTTCPPGEPCTTLIFSKIAPQAAGVFASPDSKGRHSGAFATFSDARGAFTVIGTHHLWPVPPGRQQAQTHRLAAALDRFDRRSLIVAGDFNSTPWSFSLRRQDALLGLERRTHGLATWPVRPWSRHRLWSPIAILPLDHVYAGEAWKTVSVKRGPKLGSDHLPIVVVLSREGP